MYRVNGRDWRKNEMRRDKIVLLASVLFFIAFFVYIFTDSGISLKRTTYFSPEELEVYEPPVVFLESKDGEVYFISLDDPENKHILDKDFLFYDYNPVERTFLYSNRDGAIYEYNLKEDKSICLIEKDSVCSYLNLPQNSRFGSAYYYFERGKISFVCGEYLIIYDVNNEEFIYSAPSVSEEREIEYIYGWSTPRSLIVVDGMEIIDVYETAYCEYDVYTGEKTKISGTLGYWPTLAWDKSMGCSIGYKDVFGLAFYPVLIWDTQSYEVKQLSQGADGYVQLSRDNKYVMLGRRNVETDEILCIRLEDESLCEIYTTEDRICKIIW